MARIPLGARVWFALTDRLPRLSGWRRGGAAPGVGVQDREADGPHGSISLRLYLPRWESAGRPLVILLPGDGPSASAWLPSTLARELDAAVVVVRSPFDPERPLAERVDTANAAVHWIAAHAAGWGASADRLGVVGDGPGADVLFALAPRNRDDSGPHISRQVLVSPGAEGTLPENMRGLPTSLVQVGEHDPALSVTSARVDALKKAGVPVRLAEYAAASSGWFRYPTVQKRLSRRALDDVVHFLRRGLNQESSFRVIPAWDLH